MKNRMLHREKIKVVIRCLTFNHAPYIRRCLEGFVTQQTDFKFKALIHDDASTDGTGDIVREYARRYPDLIVPLIETENQYSKQDGSLARILNAAIADLAPEYIAMCEGDDYWTDPLKLQKQVDFLDANPDYGLVHTACVKLCDGKLQPVANRPFSGEVFDALLRHEFFINTLTTCFRRDTFDSIDKTYQTRRFKMGDYPMWLEMARITKIGYLNEVTAVYRVLENSASHSKNRIKSLEFKRNVYEIKEYFIDRYCPESDYRETVDDMLSQIDLDIRFAAGDYTAFLRRYKNRKGPKDLRMRVKYGISLFKSLFK